MKLRNFANRFLLLIMLLVLCLTQANVTNLPVLVTTADAGAITTKTYYFDQYNDNKPTSQALYDTLGVKDYNTYLSTIAETQGLDEVIVAVIDTGLDQTHSVFENRILTEYALDFSKGVPSGIEDNQWYQDDKGHGTHVAGIIADLTLSNVKILPIKIFYGLKNYGSDYALNNAIRYLYALKTGKSVSFVNEAGYEYGKFTPKVSLPNLVAVNLSIGTDGYDLTKQKDLEDYNKSKPVFQNLIDHLLQCDILPIVAAGNRSLEERQPENLNKSYVSLPGTCDGTLTVSAYDNTDKQYSLANFSYFNDSVSLAAPGVEVWSACTSNIVNLLSQAKMVSIGTDKHGTYYVYEYYYGQYLTQTAQWIIRKDLNGNYYLRDNGTSMAAPFVTACYASLIGDTSKTTAEDYGLTAWDAEDTDQHFMNAAHKALLAAASTYGIHDEDGYDPKFGYGTLSLKGFATDDVTPLTSIKYETTPSENYGQASWETFNGEDKETDWIVVCVILLAAVILIWVINLFKAYSNRR